MSYLMLWSCIEHKVSLTFRAIEAALVKRDNNMKHLLLVVDWSPYRDHSNYLVCDRANTQSVTVNKETGNSITAMSLVIKWIYNIVLFWREERGMFILHHF